MRPVKLHGLSKRQYRGLSDRSDGCSDRRPRRAGPAQGQLGEELGLDLGGGIDPGRNALRDQVAKRGDGIRLAVDREQAGVEILLPQSRANRCSLVRRQGQRRDALCLSLRQVALVLACEALEVGGHGGSPSDEALRQDWRQGAPPGPVGVHVIAVSAVRPQAARTARRSSVESHGDDERSIRLATLEGSPVRTGDRPGRAILFAHDAPQRSPRSPVRPRRIRQEGMPHL